MWGRPKASLIKNKEVNSEMADAGNNASSAYNIVSAHYFRLLCYTLSEAWSGVNWADLMAAQGAFGTDFYDRSTRTIVGTCHKNRSRKGALGSHEIRPIHYALSLGQSICR